MILEERVATNPEAMKKTFEKMPSSRMALETGTHSPWVSRLLTELGHEAIVAHSRNVRLIGESRRKDDRLDAWCWYKGHNTSWAHSERTQICADGG